MNPAEVREILSQDCNFYFEKEKRFADKKDRPKKKKSRKGRRNKPKHKSWDE